MSYPKEAGGDFQFEDQSPTSHSPIQNRSRGQLSNGYPHGGNSYSPNHNSSPVGSYPEMGEPAKRYGYPTQMDYQTSYGGYGHYYGHQPSSSSPGKQFEGYHQGYGYNIPHQTYHYGTGVSNEETAYETQDRSQYYSDPRYYYDQHNPYESDPRHSDTEQSPHQKDHLDGDQDDQQEQTGTRQSPGKAAGTRHQQMPQGSGTHAGSNGRLVHAGPFSPQHDTEVPKFNVAFTSVGASPNVLPGRPPGQAMVSSYSGPLGHTKAVYQSGHLSSNEENAPVYQKGGPASAGAGFGSGQETGLPIVTPKKSIHHENELRRMYASQRAFSGADFEQNNQEIIPRKAVLSRVFTEDLREYGSKEDGVQGQSGGLGSQKPSSHFRNAYPIMKSHSLHPEDLPMYQQVATPSQMFKLFNTEDFQSLPQPRSMEIGALDPSVKVQQRKAELRKAGSQSSVNQGSVNQGSTSSQGNPNQGSSYNPMPLPQSKFTIHRSNSGVYQEPSLAPGGQVASPSQAVVGSNPPGLPPQANT